MKTALVTGATGFIGNHLLNHLLQQHYHVRALIRNPAQATQIPKEIEIIQGDLTLPASLKNICANIDTVFHLGGYAHAMGEYNPDFATRHHEINFLGTKNLIDEALLANVKEFIYFSSVKAVADTEECIDETWQHQPDTAYGIAKRQAENLLLNTQKNSTMHICILRPSLVYGPRWKGNLAAMLRAIDKGYFIPVPPVSNHRSMVSLEDICRAAVLVSRHPDANGKIYFVTDGKAYSTHELTLSLSKALGKRLPKWHLPLVIFKLLGYAGDFTAKILRRRMPFNTETLKKLFGSAAYNSQRIQNEVGFIPQYDLNALLPDIVSAYRQEQN
jgi:UDP-glucose 4-epimerase